MPQLIKGHLRYTDDDYAMQEFNEKSNSNYTDDSIHELLELIELELTQLETLNHINTMNHSNAKKNIKLSLINTLSIFTALALKQGYSLTELIKN